ncbi:carbon monoxide dehydrogenase subunit G [Pigmentiphaga sp. GD03639]|uniref:CoxG family protein n=1 Tax=unclassified Pigmentiphaga TaxID=2626614 RepID=UPI00244A2377|nr:carbon monoxide dehydrogenase subunit G [Pigmentiphaga sp. GD03639]MDH2237937.1 carbon monoxide dehydrogenase subunit G [Pigmentiphaga sp. GD03639]
MIIDGTKTLAAPRARVWEALDDLDFLRRTIPDCRAISRTDDGGYRATISAGVGPIRANFEVAFARAVQAQQERFTLTGQGSAGVAGAATGSVAVTLEDIAGGTLLAYRAETEVTGKVAQLGARMIDGAARKFSEQFFANVQRELSDGGARTAAPATGVAASVHAAPAAAAASPAAGRWQGWWLPIACGVGCFVGTFCANLLR